MSERVESGGAVPEAGGASATQVLEEPRAEQPSPAQRGEGQEALAELEQRLSERIADEVERRFQSAKDKRWSQLEKQYGALSELAETLSKQSAARREGDWAPAKAREVLEAAGLANDPEVVDLITHGQYTPGLEGYAELLGDITELVLGRAGRAPASPASVAQPSGGGTPEPDLQAEYEKEKGRLRPGDVNGLTELKRRYRAKGLDIF